MQLKCFISFFIFLHFTDVKAQDDFSVPIKCYKCIGKASNSSCADPIDPFNNKLEKTECNHGVCLKLTRYVDYELMMERTCSAKMNIHIMLVDGVCRHESYGNGYLCMCGKHLCNEANSLKLANTQVFALSLLMSTLLLLWRR